MCVADLARSLLTIACAVMVHFLTYVFLFESE